MKHGSAYITVYQPISGWKAMCVVWDEEEQEYFPEQTGYFAHPTKEKAIMEAKEWAKAEDLKFIL